LKKVKFIAQEDFLILTELQYLFTCKRVNRNSVGHIQALK